MTEPVTEFETYQADLLAKLEGKDPVEVLRVTLQTVTDLVKDLPAERLRRSPAPGEWSPAEVVSHLVDVDLVFGVRVRMIVAQDRPPLVGFDQDAWTSRFGGLDADPRVTFERWQALRLNNLRLFDSLSPAEWERVGIHAERGEQTVRLIVSTMAGHDLSHVGQIGRGLGTGSR